MKCMTIPKHAILDVPQPDATIKKIEYPYYAFLDEYVWSQPQWRDSIDYAEAMDRLLDEFEGKKEGDVIYASDLDWEKFLPLATVKGKNISPQFARPVTRHAQAALRAKTIKSMPVDDVLVHTQPVASQPALVANGVPVSNPDDVPPKGPIGTTP